MAQQLLRFPVYGISAGSPDEPLTRALKPLGRLQLHLPGYLRIGLSRHRRAGSHEKTHRLVQLNKPGRSRNCNRAEKSENTWLKVELSTEDAAPSTLSSPQRLSNSSRRLMRTSGVTLWKLEDGASDQHRQLLQSVAGQMVATLCDHTPA